MKCFSNRLLDSIHEQNMYFEKETCFQNLNVLKAMFNFCYQKGSQEDGEPTKQGENILILQSL